MSEDYVRPPIVALEVTNPRAAVWRFRIVMGLLALLLIVVIVLITRAIVHNNDTGGAVGLAGHPRMVATAVR